MTIDKRNIEGIVLSGGEGRRMGGADKGLVAFMGLPLAQRAVLRLSSQVGAVKVSAARNLDVYAQWGCPVVPDAGNTREGPLAGVLAAMTQCTAAFLAVVPCDAPLFPEDLVERLALALDQTDALVAMPLAAQEDAAARPDPSFMLIRREALSDLEAYFQAGGRKITTWAGKAGLALAPFTAVSDAQAFLDADTPEALARLEALAHARS